MQIIEMKKFQAAGQSNRGSRPALHQRIVAGETQRLEELPEGRLENSWSAIGGLNIPESNRSASNGRGSLLSQLGMPKPSDDLIHSRIIFGLFSDPLVDDTHIGVRVVNGLVTLSGEALDRCQKNRAEHIAAGEEGVTIVRNLLTVVSPYPSGGGH
ncbi:MAG: BON domain-containing protein [Desulfobacteraceae bacterium]|nr:BON domain-containing protein [Desulfobacteraceae bacterium]